MLYFSKNKLWKVIKFENSAECRTLVSANFASPFFFQKLKNKIYIPYSHPDTYLSDIRIPDRMWSILQNWVDGNSCLELTAYTLIWRHAH